MSASLARSALVLFGLALGVLCAEGALHVLGPRLPGLYNLATFQAYHPIYGFFHRPGARGWVRTDEFTSYVQINSRGLRDREVAIPKPAQTFRLLVLGDSIVEGSQVALDQTLPKQLEQLLGGGPGRPLEAINAGNAGFGTAQELLFLQHDGPAYGPDVVVLVFYVDNDAANNGIGVAQKRGLSTAGRPFFVLDSDGNLLQVPVASMPPEPLGQLKDVLRNSSLLYDVGENLLTARAAAKQYHAVRMDKDRTMYLIEPPREWQDAWAVTEALLERARESASAIGAELVVVAAPSQFQVYERDWRMLLNTTREAELKRYDQAAPNRRLAAAAERAGVRLLDLLPTFRAAAASNGAAALYFAEDGHWTPAGHGLAAQQLAAYLGEHGLLPTWTRPA